MIDDADASRSVLEPLRPAESELAFRDDLTGLYNYRLLNRLLEDGWDDLVRLSGSFALVLVDLNLFKQVNDRYGHLAGDDVLRETARILLASFRKGDFVFRYGGDEFVVLLPGADAAEAHALGDRARSAMLANDFVTTGGGRPIEVPVSFSIGVAAFPADAVSGLALLASADARLYEDKKSFLEPITRRRRIVSGIAAVVAVAVVALVLKYVVPAEPREPAAPSPIVVTSPPATDSAGTAEAELLMQIQQLKEQLDKLTRERESSGAPAPAPKPPEIVSLEKQVADLTARLAAQQSARAAEPPDIPAVAAPVRQPVAAAAPQPAATPAVRPDSESTARTENEPRIEMPKLLQPIVPRYPSLAREKGVEATVQLRVLVDEEGKVVRASLAGSEKGYGLDDAAKAAALSSRWRPGTRNGTPVPMEANLQVIFKIR